MFSPISLKEEKVLEQEGKIFVSISRAWGNSQSPTSIPYNIRYVRNFPDKTYEDILLYTCYTTISSTRLTFSNLKKTTFINNSFYSSEAAMYSLLRMVLKRLIEWTEELKKSHIMIMSDLPHIAEHFVDLKFKIKKRASDIVAQKSLV